MRHFNYEYFSSPCLVDFFTLLSWKQMALNYSYQVLQSEHGAELPDTTVSCTAFTGKIMRCEVTLNF